MSKKRERFLRIAETRTKKIISMLRLLGNCSDKNNYEYTEDEVKQIFNAVTKEVNASRSRFSGLDAKEEVFKLR